MTDDRSSGLCLCYNAFNIIILFICIKMIFFVCDTNFIYLWHKHNPVSTATENLLLEMLKFLGCDESKEL